jgi:hypothetical protein
VISVLENGSEGLYVAFDSVEFLSQLGANFTGYFDSIQFDWKRLAGARILAINGQDPYSYVDYIAHTVSGNFLDHGVRVNSVFSSYRISPNILSQRLGDLAGPTWISQTSLTMTLVTISSATVETVTIPYLATFLGTNSNFTDSASLYVNQLYCSIKLGALTSDISWAQNCAAKNTTNGVDLKHAGARLESTLLRKLAKGAIIDKSSSNGIALPPQYVPTAPKIPGGSGVVQSFVLDNQTGVVGSDSPLMFFLRLTRQTRWIDVRRIVY